MDDDGLLLSIGELARRSGLPVRTIRFWSDAGVLPPAERTEGGRRLYDAACVARLELIVTLRELGLGLPEVRRVLAGQASVAEVAAVHVEALDAGPAVSAPASPASRISGNGSGRPPRSASRLRPVTGWLTPARRRRLPGKPAGGGPGPVLPRAPVPERLRTVPAALLYLELAAGATAPIAPQQR